MVLVCGLLEGDGDQAEMWFSEFPNWYTAKDREIDPFSDG
jgi:hypothetical protein